MVAYAVERGALHHARQTEAVVTVEVRDADTRDLGRARTGEQHLALRAFTGIKQRAASVPTKQVAIVVAVTRRDLGRRTEYHQLSCHRRLWLPRCAAEVRWHRTRCPVGRAPEAVPYICSHK